MRWPAYLGYAAPALPLAALYFPVFVYIAPFYSEFRDVSLGALGVLFIAVRLFDAVSDPAMGWLSDRTTNRFGRRRPYLALSVPLICVSVWMLMVPPADADVWHVAIWLTLLTLSWTVALTPYFAWGAELSGDYAQRATITTWREGASLMGTVLAVILYNIAEEPGGRSSERSADGGSIIANSRRCGAFPDTRAAEFFSQAPRFAPLSDKHPTGSTVPAPLARLFREWIGERPTCGPFPFLYRRPSWCA